MAHCLDGRRDSREVVGDADIAVHGHTACSTTWLIPVDRGAGVFGLALAGARQAVVPGPHVGADDQVAAQEAHALEFLDDALDAIGDGELARDAIAPRS